MRIVIFVIKFGEFIEVFICWKDHLNKKTHLNMVTFKKNDIVRFLPEYEDGDSEFDYILIEEPDGDRVIVKPISSGLEIPPIYVAETKWLKFKSGISIGGLK